MPCIHLGHWKSLAQYSERTLDAVPQSHGQAVRGAAVLRLLKNFHEATHARRHPSAVVRVHGPISLPRFYRALALVVMLQCSQLDQICMLPSGRYDDLLDYLEAKDPSVERLTLGFEGRDTVIFRRAR